MFVVYIGRWIDAETDIVSEYKEYDTLEEAWQEYNKSAAGSHVIAVSLLVPIKEFKR